MLQPPLLDPTRLNTKLDSKLDSMKFETFKVIFYRKTDITG